MLFKVVMLLTIGNALCLRLGSPPASPPVSPKTNVDVEVVEEVVEEFEVPKRVYDAGELQEIINLCKVQDDCYEYRWSG